MNELEFRKERIKCPSPLNISVVYGVFYTEPDALGVMMGTSDVLALVSIVAIYS